jgi:hypothetical protein
MNTTTLPTPPDHSLTTVPLYLTQLHVTYDQTMHLLRIRDTYD